MTATALFAISLSGISLSSVVPAANHSSDDVLMSEHTHDGAGQRGRGCNAVPAGHLNTGDYAHHQVVCACSEALGCDTVEPEGPIGASSVVLYESHASEGGNPARHMARFEHVISSRPFEIFERELLVGCERRQTMRGFGGAFTDSSAAHFTAMPPAVKEHFLESYFGGGADATTGAPAARDGGIGYSLGRVVLGSADFSTGVWSYDDVEGDLNLTHFSLQRDEASGKLPMIRAALAKRAQPTAGAGAGARAGGGQSSAGDHGGSAAGGWRESAGGKGSGGGQRQGHAAAGVAGTTLKPALSLYGSAWAPPAWMTTTNATLHCTMKDGYAPGAPHATAFARYLRLALDGYANAGAPLFGVTAGNEPNRLGQSWQQLVMSAADQREWIAHHLGPALKPKLARQLAQRNASVLPAAASPPPHVAAAADAAGASAANHRAGAAAASSETWPDTEYELMMLDDQRTYIHSWAQAVLGAETSAHRPRARARSAGSGDVAAAAPPPPADAASYVDGIGFHWCVAQRREQRGARTRTQRRQACNIVCPWNWLALHRAPCALSDLARAWSAAAALALKSTRASLRLHAHPALPLGDLPPK